MKQSIFRPNFPFSPANFPIFYGWVIVFASILGVLTSIPGQTIGVSVFTDHLINATGLSRLQLANAYLLGTLTSGCLLPFGGKLLDRLGARRVVVLAAVGLGITLGYLAMCDRLSLFLSAFLPLSKTNMAAVLLVVGFVSLRFCGQGMLTMTSRTTLGKWFDRRRGQVSGLQGIFTAAGFSIAPYVFSRAITLFGWRNTWFVLSLFVGLGMSTIGWLLFRDNPEMCGLRMDGVDLSEGMVERSFQESSKGIAAEQVTRRAVGQIRESKLVPVGQQQVRLLEERPQPNAESQPNAEVEMWGVTRREAVGTLAFWAVNLAFMSQALSITGITFNIVSIGAEMGIAEADIVQIFVPIAVVSTAVGYGVGLACDRIRIQYLFIFMMLFQAVGIASLANLNVPGLLIPTVVGLGVSGGCFGTLSAVVLPRFFGRKHLGAISGVQMMAIVIASAIGPSWLANAQFITGSYTAGLYACCLFAPVVIILMMIMQTPSKHPPSDGVERV